MSTQTRKQIIKPNEDALAAFVSKRAEIDAMLARLQSLSEDHFGYAPDEITWSHVGTLEHYSELLRRVTDMAFNEATTRPSPSPISDTTPRAAVAAEGSPGQRATTTVRGPGSRS